MNKQRETGKQNIHRRPDYYRSQKHLFSRLEQTKKARLQRDKQNKGFCQYKQSKRQINRKTMKVENKNRRPVNRRFPNTNIIYK